MFISQKKLYLPKSRMWYLNNSPPVIFNNENISRVNIHKHLRVHLTSNLGWSVQIHNVCLKANRKLSALKRVQNLQRFTLDLIFKIMVRSVLDYSLFVYFYNLNQLDVEKLDRVQYRAAKLVTSTLHFISREKLESELGWQTSRADYPGLTLFHKIHCNATRPLVKICMPNLSTWKNSIRSQTVYVKFPITRMTHKNRFFLHTCHFFGIDFQQM